MIAGNPKNEAEEMIYAIREICPGMGIIVKNGEMILTGNEINHLSGILEIISRIKSIDSLNKYCTHARLVVKDEQAMITDEHVEIEIIRKKKSLNSEWIYPRADALNPHQCSNDCQRPETEAGCLGCPLA